MYMRRSLHVLFAFCLVFPLLHAEEQVFSHEPGFCWMDESLQYQTDWALFSKEKY